MVKTPTLPRIALLALMVPAMAMAQTTVDSVRDCAAANAPEQSFSQRATFVTTDRVGASRTLTSTVYGKSEDGKLRLTLHVSQPPDVAGTAILLRREDDDDSMFIYLPALKKSRRITGGMTSTKLLGTDFSYNDIQQLFGALSNGQAELLAPGTVGDRAVHRVELRPQVLEGGDFVQVIASVDEQTCVPLQVDFVDADDVVVKRLRTDVDSIQTVAGRKLATHFVMEDRVAESSTELTLSRVEFDERIPLSLFHPRGYYQPR